MFIWRSTYNKLKAENEILSTALATEISNAKRDLNEKQLENLRLTSAIRNIDQVIFQMSQCTTWDEMRPYFNQLQRAAAQRQKAESDLIGRLVIDDMNNQPAKYTPEALSKDDHNG